MKKVKVSFPYENYINFIFNINIIFNIHKIKRLSLYNIIQKIKNKNIHR